MDEFEELAAKLSNLFVVETPKCPNVLQKNTPFSDVKYSEEERWGKTHTASIEAHTDSPHASVVQRVMINEHWPKPVTEVSAPHRGQNVMWLATSGVLHLGCIIKNRTQLVALKGKELAISQKMGPLRAHRVWQDHVFVMLFNDLKIFDSKMQLLATIPNTIPLEAFSASGSLVDMNGSHVYIAVGNTVYSWNYLANYMSVYREYNAVVHRMRCDDDRVVVSFCDGSIHIAPDDFTVFLFARVSIYNSVNGREEIVDCVSGPLTDLAVQGAYMTASCNGYRAAYHLRDHKMCVKAGSVDHIYLYGNLMLSTYCNAALGTGLLVESVFDYDKTVSYFTGKLASDAMAFAYANRSLLPPATEEERDQLSADIYKQCLHREREFGARRQLIAMCGGDVFIITADNTVVQKEF